MDELGQDQTPFLNQTAGIDQGLLPNGEWPLRPGPRQFHFVGDPGNGLHQVYGLPGQSGAVHDRPRHILNGALDTVALVDHRQHMDLGQGLVDLLNVPISMVIDRGVKFYPAHNVNNRCKWSAAKFTSELICLVWHIYTFVESMPAKFLKSSGKKFSV